MDLIKHLEQIKEILFSSERQCYSASSYYTLFWALYVCMHACMYVCMSCISFYAYNYKHACVLRAEKFEREIIISPSTVIRLYYRTITLIFIFPNVASHHLRNLWMQNISISWQNFPAVQCCIILLLVCDIV